MTEDAVPEQNAQPAVGARPVRKHRRVHVPAVPGTDPTPQVQDAPARATEDTDRAWGARATDTNDDRLKQDVPPHW
ncbi:hypothetical protein [Leifsonia poae]|uniref:hypothetical protein n=1 Tax=Leifsonia poae TaxID=110933 RepID=UPI003D67B399